MKHLVIDSATKYLYVALFNDDKMLAFKGQINFRDHTTFIIAFIDELLKVTNTTREEITDITVGNGPGSYTGVRIAGTVAKTLSYLLGCPLYFISSLYLLTSGYFARRLVTYDARNGRAFYLVVDNSVPQIPALSPAIKSLVEEHDLVLELNQPDITALVKIDMQNICKYRQVGDAITYFPNYCLKTKAEQDHDKSA